MFIDSREIRLTARLNPLGLGTSSFRDVNEAAYAAGRAINLEISQSLNITQAYDDYIDHIFKTTGQRLRNPAHFWQGDDPKTSPNAPGRVALHAEEFHAEANKLAEDGRFAPLSAEAITLQSNARAAALEREYAEINGRAHLAGKLGGFAGTVGAFFTDPIIALSALYNPGRAVGVLATGAKLAAVTGGAELLVQPQIQKYRAVLGLEHGFGMGARNVAFAAGAGGVFGVGIKLAGMGMRSVLDMHTAVVGEGVRTANERLARLTAERFVAEHEFNLAANPEFTRQAAAAAEDGVALRSFEPTTPRQQEFTDAGGFGPTPRERDAADAGGFGETGPAMRLAEVTPDVAAQRRAKADEARALDARATELNDAAQDLFDAGGDRAAGAALLDEAKILWAEARLRLAEESQIGREGEAMAEGFVAGARRSYDRAVEAARPTPKLPKKLAGAKPRYQKSELVFASDIDRALFIISQKTLSRRDADYRAWLRETLDATDADIDELAQQTRAAVDDAAKNRGADGDPINVGAADFQVKGQELPPAPRPDPARKQPQQVRDRTPEENADHAVGAAAAAEVIKETGSEIPEDLAIALAILRGETKMPDPGQSLVQWLIANGGVRDESGWLAGVLRMERGGSAMPRLLNNQGIEVTERLTKKGDVRKTPMNIEDEAGARAAEAGFFPKEWQEIIGPGESPNMRAPLERAIEEELSEGGRKLYILNEDSLAAQDMDATVRALEEDLFRAGLDIDELSDAEIAAGHAKHETAMQEDFRVMVETDPDMEVPVGTTLDSNGNSHTMTATAKQIQDEIDGDQVLIDELNNCFIPGFSI